MKKIALFALAALALMSCQREVVDPQESSVPTYTVTITARLAQTRTDYDDAGKFSWSAGDKINVLITNGTVQKQAVFTTAEAGPEVQFTGEVDEGFTVGADAAFALDFNAEKKAWCFPERLPVDPVKPLAGLPLFGAKDAGGLFQFKTATGILKFTVENVPVETAAVFLETIGDDAPALCGELEAAPADGVVTMAALKNGGKKLIVADAAAEPNTTKDYYFFVPAGTLPAGKTQFSVVDASDNAIQRFVFQKDVEVKANRITNVAPVRFEPVKVVNRQTDSLALVAIYNAADGANWKEERRWDLTQPIDTWYGVKLTGGRVSQLAVTASGVISSSWTLPKEIGNLTELTVLKFNQCKLTGEIPEEVFTLSKLTDLYFQSNDLTGTFSDKYTRLTNLKNLYINNNKDLQGTLPASIGNLKDLESINIAQTNFSGTIPVELGQCTNLKNIMAWGNDLSGEIPDFWDQLPNVGVVQFYGNPGITGPIPPTMGTLKKATGVQLKECNLTGNIPASFGGLEKCINLQLNGNKLSGVVPAEVQAHPKWQATSGWKYEVNILPQQEGYELLLEAPAFSRQTDSLALVKVYNLADGANWKESRRWTLTEPLDKWPGIKLNKEGRVIEMSITNGTVTTVDWEMPAELANLTALQTIQIVGSKLKGEIPAWFYDMTSLSKVRLNSNDLTGSLSDKLGQLTELTELYLNLNKQFAGNLPSSIGQLQKLESLNIAQTAIGGEIPQSLSQCKALKNFMAWNNQLSGEIPDFWDQLPNVGVLQLYGNPGLTGNIPASIGTLKSATGIQLKECNLTGNIPASFGGLEKCGNLQLNGNKLSGVVPTEVQTHPKWQATSGWKYETNILPQQEGYGLTLE